MIKQVSLLLMMTLTVIRIVHGLQWNMLLVRLIYGGGKFWNRLFSTLENDILIIKGAMHLHNFLADYRNSSSAPTVDYALNRSIFVDKICDNGICNIMVTNDDNRGEGGHPTNDEKQRRINGVLLREKLKNSLRKHKMHRLRKDNEWVYDKANRIDDTHG